MAFPSTPLPFGFELYYNGAWNDHTADVSDEGISITRGRSDESAQVEPARMSLSLKNSTGKYSPRNPNSSLYGKIGRNTPCRLWVEHGAAYLGSNRHYRFYGEVSEWPQKWGLKGAPQARCNIECSGTLRRLGQGASPLRSALYRGISALGSNLVGYFPLEDSEGSSNLYNALGKQPGRIYGAPTLSGYDGFVASARVPTLQSGRIYLPIQKYTNTNAFQVRFLARIPAATPNNAIICRVTTDNSLGWIDLIYTTGGYLSLQPYTNLGAATTALGPVAFNVDGRDLRISIEAKKNGTGIDFTLVTLEEGYASGSYFTSNVASATLGSCTAVDFNVAQASLGDVAVGHVTVEKAITSIFDLSSQLNAFFGETAAARISRLCTENGLTLALVGVSSTTETVGYQKERDLLTLLRDAESTDHGILYEPRSTGGLAYRTLASMYSQTAGARIAYSDNLLLPFEPIDDDQATRNKVSVSREGGSTSIIEDTTSTLSTQAPPLGVGVYDESVTLSLRTDEQARQQASWLVHVGTVDEARWPQIGLDFAHPTLLADSSLTRSLLLLDLGDRLVVDHLPSWLPPFDVDQIVQGYTETITPFSYKIVYSCSPAKPYRVPTYGTSGDRYSNDSSKLNTACSSTATVLSVKTLNGPLWTTASGDFPFNVLISGELITVTSISGTSSPQTFTVTRSVNGVVKAHSVDEQVTLYDSTYYGL